MTQAVPTSGASAPRVPADLAGIVDDLDLVTGLGPDRLDAGVVEEASALRRRIDERLAIGDALTVVALLGGTGVGKSALLNRLVGEQVATEGVRRPTTDVPVAVAGRRGTDVDALLDWLDVHDRRVVTGGMAEDLVLVDLPDHDSIEEDHRRTADRLRRRVDGLIVVVDPLKYARADLHDGPLADLLAHAEVTVVAFNHVDELSGTDRDAALTDAREKLRDGGHPDLEVLPTSAVTGEGVDELRRRVTDLAERRSAAVRRLVGDAAIFGRAALAAAPDPGSSQLEASQLLDPLLEATDAHRSGVEAGVAYQRAARRGSRSPIGRLVRAPFGFAARAVRDLGIVSPAPAGGRTANVGARVEGVLARELELVALTGVTHRTTDRAISRTAADAAPELLDAVRSVQVQPPQRAWWTAMSWIRGAAEAAALTGLVWLVLVGVASWLQLPPVPTPEVTEDLSWPAALFLYGLGARVVLGIASRIATHVGAGRWRSAVTDQLRDRLRQAIDERIVEPYREEAGRQRRLHDAAARLADRAAPAA